MTIRAAFFAVRHMSRRFVRDDRGVILALVAVMITVLLGVAGLAFEPGLWYAIKRQDQTAADIAAISGAMELNAGRSFGLTDVASYPGICGQAKNSATGNGFSFASFSCPTTSPGCTTLTSSAQMCVNNPPAVPGTPNTGNANAVEVLLATQQDTFLARAVASTPSNVTIRTRAVAIIKKLDDACLLALGTSGSDIVMKGTASQVCFTVDGSCASKSNCAIAANSTSSSAVSLTGNPHITADTIITPGGISGHTTNVKLSSGVTAGASAVLDPYASTLTHATLQTGMPGTCTTKPSGAGTFSYTTDVRFCNGLTIGNKQTVDLKPPASGHLTVWITDGDLDLSNTSSVLQCSTCNLASGAGITIILTKGTGAGAKVGGISMKAGATINSLNAPNSGTFSGVLIAQDPAGPFTTPSTSGSACNDIASPCSTLQGGPGATLTGLVYFPKTGLDFQGNPAVGSKACLLVVANQVELQGNAHMQVSGCSSAGLSKVPTITNIVLAE